MSRLAALLAGLLLLAGCGEVLDTTYGLEKPGSVDGASVLVQRLGERTRLRRAALLSPRLQQDCTLIVHLAEEAGLPDAATCTWLEDWLHEEDGRQAVLVLRGDSPAPLLCRRWADEARAEGARVGGRLGDELRALAGRFERAAAAAGPSSVTSGGAELSCPLFTLRPAPAGPAHAVILPDGADAPAPALLRVGPQIVAEDAVDGIGAVLADGGTRAWSVAIPVGGSRLVVAVNGSPILDGALPDPRARALLAHWLDDIVAWHDGEVPACAWLGSLRVREGEPEPANPMAMIFAAWPLALATWHLLALVALWLLARACWLGRRRDPRAGRGASFGDHVDALAAHLAAERQQQAAARAIARASGLPVPPHLRDAEAARTWLAAQAAAPEESR